MTQNLQANIIKRWICFTCFTHTCSLVYTGNGWNAHWNTENVQLLPSPTSTDLAKLSPKKPGKETSWGSHFLLQKVDSWRFHVHLSKTMTWHIPSWQLSHPPRKALLRKNDFPNFPFGGILMQPTPRVHAPDKGEDVARKASSGNF